MLLRKPEVADCRHRGQVSRRAVGSKSGSGGAGPRRVQCSCGCRGSGRGWAEKAPKGGKRMVEFQGNRGAGFNEAWQSAVQQKKAGFSESELAN
jgi:hypothetical protein